jgi:hypothetical protein
LPQNPILPEYWILKNILDGPMLVLTKVMIMETVYRKEFRHRCSAGDTQLRKKKMIKHE